MSKDDGMRLRPLMLECLPGNDISNHVEAPSSKSGKVNICRTVFEVERASYEALSTILANLVENV